MSVSNTGAQGGGGGGVVKLLPGFCSNAKAITLMPVSQLIHVQSPLNR